MTNKLIYDFLFSHTSDGGLGLISLTILMSLVGTRGNQGQPEWRALYLRFQTLQVATRRKGTEFSVANAEAAHDANAAEKLVVITGSGNGRVRGVAEQSHPA